jgi:hypothetical protein
VTWLHAPLVVVLGTSSPIAAGVGAPMVYASIDTVRLDSSAPDTTEHAADTVAMVPGDWRRGARTGFKIGLGVGIVSLVVLGALLEPIGTAVFEDVPPEAVVLVPLVGGTAIGAMATRHDRPAETDSRARR